jgi:hypothetical protein
LKQTVAIIAFASLTVLPPVIAGLRAAPSPQVAAPVASATDDDFFSLAGAFCVTPPSGEQPSEGNTSYALERTLHSDGDAIGPDLSVEETR